MTPLLSSRFRASRFFTTWAISGLLLSLSTVAWLMYSAITEWQRSATLLAQERAQGAAALLVTALSRDMRGAQESILATPRADDRSGGPGADVHRIASAFARYPYPEVFFSASGAPSRPSMLFYSRAERHPEWLGVAEAEGRFPVEISRDEAAASSLLDRVRVDTALGRRFSIFELGLGRARYQVVAAISYDDPFRERASGIFGYAVNLDWAREHYFVDVVAQVARIPSARNGLALAVFDGQGRPLVGARRDVGGEPSSRRELPLMFFDPLLVAADPPPDLHRESLTVQATAFDDPTLRAAKLGAGRTLTIAGVTTVVLAVAFVLSVNAVRANAALAGMRSDFVAVVTHELKSPIATIRAINETLASGRTRTPEVSREYAQLAVHQAKRLTRLIDNLLAYARVTDVTEVYSFEPIGIRTVVDEVLQDFASQLEEARFEVACRFPADLPPVRIDRTAVGLMISNLLDNAIRYSAETRRIDIAAVATGASLTLDVADHGVGIPEHEMPHVTRKFFRGGHSTSGGSGLGLAIVQRIVTDHGGVLGIRSAVGAGTTVSITFPLASRS